MVWHLDLILVGMMLRFKKRGALARYCTLHYLIFGNRFRVENTAKLRVGQATKHLDS
jgi:hypothetical protein